MKKNRLLTIVGLSALTLLLASCTISVQPAPKPVRAFTFESSWRVTGSNQWAACDNQLTVFEYTFHADNPALVQGITEHYQGVVTNDKKTASVNSNEWSVSGNRITVQASFNAGGNFLPLAQPELGSQAIVVTPVQPADQRGSTRFWVEVEYGSLGVTYTSTPVTVAVYGNCTPTGS